MRFILAAMLLAAAPLTPALAQGSWTTSTRAPELSRVAEAVHDGRADDALEMLDPILASYDQIYGDTRSQILCVENLGDIPRYLKALGVSSSAQFVAIDTGWCFALWAKGYALVDLNRIAEAVPYLERAAAMEPVNSQYLSELGNAYQSLKQWDKALATFTRAADAAEALEGANRVRWLTRAWRGLGFSLVELGRWDEARAMYLKCLELDPNDEKSKGELQYIEQNRPKR